MVTGAVRVRIRRIPHRRPCSDDNGAGGRCIKLQLGAECQPWMHIIQADNNQKRRVRRQPDGIRLFLVQFEVGRKSSFADCQQQQETEAGP
eukprot:1659716-Rhodomonas_salina.1